MKWETKNESKTKNDVESKSAMGNYKKEKVRRETEAVIWFTLCFFLPLGRYDGGQPSDRLQSSESVGERERERDRESERLGVKN